jgi:hypothetical protein
MVVKANGNVMIIDFTAKFTALPHGRVSISDVPACSAAGLYRWKSRNGHLSLAKIRDASPAFGGGSSARRQQPCSPVEWVG